MENSLSCFPLILLAGGKSSRMGFPKGLMEVQGKPWLLHQIESFRAIGGRDAIIILGYGAEAYQVLNLEKHGVTVVINPEPEYGPFSSIQAGAKAVIERNPPGAFILPIDVPVAEKETWLTLVENLKPEVRICQPIFEDQGRERGGHPALLSKRELSCLHDLPKTDRLDQRIHRLSTGELARVRVNDSSVLVNLNSPEDWEWFSSRGGRALSSS